MDTRTMLDVKFTGGINFNLKKFVEMEEDEIEEDVALEEDDDL